MLLLAYGAGFYLDPPPENAVALDKISVAPLPPAAAPTEGADLTALQGRIDKDTQVSSPPDAPPLVLLSEDWRTGGDFLGRYGRFWTCLCGVNAPKGSFLWGAGDQPVSFVVGRSRQHRPDDSWCSLVSDLTSSRSLEMPFPVLNAGGKSQPGDPTFNRLQGEWNDNGQNGYIRDYDGPHLRCNIKIPQGLFILSYYNINENRQLGINRFRDYRVTLRIHQGTLDDIESDFTNEPEISTTRTMSFYEGCYTRWLVRGPNSVTLEINRNFSLNAKMSGLMLDSVDELPPPYLETWQDYHDPTRHGQFQSAHLAQSENAPTVVARALSGLDGTQYS